MAISGGNLLSSAGGLLNTNSVNVGGQKPLTLFGNDISGLGPYSTSSNSSGSSSKSWSGIKMPDWLSESLKSSAINFPGGINSFEKEGLNSLDNIGRTAIKSPITSLLNSLAKKNVLNSSVLGDSIKKLGSGVSDSLLSHGVDIVNSANSQRLALPGILTNMANLYRESESKSTSSGGGSSKSGNTLAPYQTMLDAQNQMMSWG